MSRRRLAKVSVRRQEHRRREDARVILFGFRNIGADDKPARRCHYCNGEAEALLAPGILVDLTGAPQRDLIMRELPALRHWRSLRMRIGLRFRTRMRGFTDIDRLSAVNWSDHSLVL